MAEYTVLESHGAREPTIPKPAVPPKASIVTAQEGLPMYFGIDTVPVCQVRLVHPTNPQATSKNLSLSVLYVPPHAKLELHSHETEEIYYIIEGRGTFYLTEGKRPVETNTAIHLPAWCEHGIENTGPGMLVSLVMTSPPNP